MNAPLNSDLLLQLCLVWLICLAVRKIRSDS